MEITSPIVYDWLEQPEILDLLCSISFWDIYLSFVEFGKMYKGLRGEFRSKMTIEDIIGGTDAHETIITDTITNFFV